MRSMRGANRLDQSVFAPGAEAFEDLGHGALEVGDSFRPAVQRGQHVDQHDLPVEPGEMIAEERPHDMRFVGLVAPLHHRP